MNKEKDIMGSGVSESKISMLDPEAMEDIVKLSEDDAITRAAACIGLIKYNRAEVTAQIVTLSTESVPFLAGKLAGRDTWRIEFNNLHLDAAGKNPRLANPNIRTLIVLLSPHTGHVMKVTSVWPKGLTAMAPYPSCKEEENQLSRDSDHYTWFPSEAPGVSLLEAMANEETMPWSKEVKQIHAYYVLCTTEQFESRPVWVIHLRGFPPLVMPGPEGVDRSNDIPYDHLRNVIDARTGEWLSADNIPQPVAALEERY